MKKNIFKPIIIILCTLLILALAYFITNKHLINKDSNPKQNEGQNDKQSTPNLFVLKEDYDVGISLISIDNNGEEKTIYDFSKYNRYIEDSFFVNYYYDAKENKIYLNIKSNEQNNYTSNSQWEIATIDLNTTNDEYKLNILTTINIERDKFDKMFADNITKLGNNIYFANSYLYKLNLDDLKIQKMDIKSEKASINVYSYGNNTLIYDTYNGTRAIYKYNISTNKQEKIANNANIEYVYKNELIYQDDNYDFYSYNLDTFETKKIRNGEAKGTLGFSFIIPYNNSYLNTINNTFYYNDKDTYEFSCEKIDSSICHYLSIDKYMIYGNNLVINLRDMMGELPPDGDIALDITVDLNTKEIKSIKKLKKAINYSKFTYIK